MSETPAPFPEEYRLAPRAHGEQGDIGTEHLLLDLIREPEGLVGQILREAGVTLEEVRKRVP